MRYFIFFGYDGTNYHGWQIQPNANSVQQELQRALSILLRKEIEVVGAGRTDTGVHARNMAAHFEAEITMELDQLVYRLTEFCHVTSQYTKYRRLILRCTPASLPPRVPIIIISTQKRTHSSVTIPCR